MFFTPKLKWYMAKLAFRVSVVGAVLVLYLLRRHWLLAMMHQNIRYGVTPIHVLWLIFMGIMLMHLFPGKLRSMALLKMRGDIYRPVEGYSELELLRFVQDQNQKAWMVLLVWLFFNAIWGVLYLFGMIGELELLLLSTVYFLCDYICILFFCPFQTVIMKNKCCVNCRIYDWGHFMMFTPMLFIRNFFSWSLFFTSLVVLIRWEIVYATHAERFWFGSNKILQCSRCKDGTCHIKQKLAKGKGEMLHE